METRCALLLVLLSVQNALSVLPTDFTVTSYDLGLTAGSLPTDTVTGSVNITLLCTKAGTTDIVFHWGSTLKPDTPTATTFKVTRQGPALGVATDVTLTSVNVDTTLQTVTLRASASFEQNTNVAVYIQSYTVTVGKDLMGLFSRQFSNYDNSQSSILATNLKPLYARELFPSLDEPSLPAQIKLTVTHPSDWKVVSSLPLLTSNVVDRVTTDTFTSQNALPPNVLSIFLSNDMTKTSYTQSARSTTNLNFWTPKDFPATLLGTTVDTLGSYYFQVEDFLGTTHPLRSLDIVLVPGLAVPFSGYGLVFIRNDSYAGSYSSAQAEGLFKQTVVPVMNQFLRQFTECSTRPKTWADGWLSQALARYLQHALLKNMNLPPFDFLTELEVVDRQTALALDTQASRPLEDSEIKAESAPAVELALQDPLKAYKGAFLLSMLDMSLPAGVVFSAIKGFLKDKSQASVTSAEFYTQIQTYTNMRSQPISTDTSKALETLAQWFKTAGYPLVHVNVASTGSPGSVTLGLTGFCYKAPCAAVEAYSVPVTVGSQSDPRYYMPRQDLWVTAANASTSLAVAPGDWVLANSRSSGYYRAQYSSANWDLLNASLSRSSNEIVGRTQLIDDAFALSAAGLVDYKFTLKLVTAAMKESSYRNLFPLHTGLWQIRDRLWGLPLYQSFKDYTSSALKILDKSLKSGSLDNYERSRITALFMDGMCEFDIPEYRNFAVGNLTALLKGQLPTSVVSSAYDAVVCCGAQYQKAITAQMLWNNITESAASYYKRHFNAVALGCLANYTEITELYNSMTSADIVLKPLVLTTFKYIADTHPIGFTANVTSIADKLQKQLGAAALASLIGRAGRKLNYNTVSSPLDGMASASVDSVVKTAATATQKAISERIAWLTDRNTTLVAALKADNPNPPTSGASTLVSIVLLLPPCLAMLTIL